MEEERRLTEPETAGQAAPGTDSGTEAPFGPEEAAEVELSGAESVQRAENAVQQGSDAEADANAAAGQGPDAEPEGDTAAGEALEGASHPEEALRRQLERQRQALAAERAAFERERLTALVERELRSRGLAEEFAPFLMGESPAESLEKVERFQALYVESLRRELEGRLRLTEPPREPEQSRGWSREALRRMSAGEINRNWEEIARTLSR